MPLLSGTGSTASDDSHPNNNNNTQKKGGDLPPPVLVYHESARSIVFRDHLRRAVQRSESSSSSTKESSSPPSAHDGTKVQDNNINTDSSIFVQHEEHDRKDSIQAIASDIGHTLGLDVGETVVPSEAGIPETKIAGYQPRIQPLPSMELGPNDVFTPLLDSPNGYTDSTFWSPAEREVVQLLRNQQACVKTIKNTDWTAFLHRFCFPNPNRGRAPKAHDDVAPDAAHPFNSFVTSASMLPDCGEKMRCFGSPSLYTTGVVFAMPRAFCNETEDEAATKAQVWSWPAGYSAKTEFNIDSRGRLINGRQEAIVPLSVLRQYNEDYLTKDEYMISSRLVSGLQQIPYNEVFLRVGGLGRIVEGKDVATGEEKDDTSRSFDRGVGLPVALFVRTATYGHLISLMRTRARLMHTLGEHHFKGIPLLLITPELGVRVLTEKLQHDLWKLASSSLNPFQNPTIAHKTTVDNTADDSFQQKVEELLELDETISEILTPEELARLAGGFGATDDSVATILKQLVMHDKKVNKQKHADHKPEDSHMLQDVVNEGLTAAVRSGDYHTSRQLLILYSLVASRADELDDDDDSLSDYSAEDHKLERPKHVKGKSSLGDAEKYLHEVDVARRASTDGTLSTAIPPPPPPPPLDTDRLRSATNSDGLLAVLGAAQVLKAMQDGSAMKRAKEAVAAVEEWVNYGEQSVAFRISSWYDQRAAQDDLKIATENNSNFMAFVSNKAIANRKNFAEQLRQAVSETSFNDMDFLQGIDAMLSRMHSPCLRLELLQYVLGLDNRYSVAHCRRSVELAATCLGISTSR